VRSPVLGADGALYLTTDNGEGDDRLLRVTPTG
jgi:glucose/arabinose dehydrogenase